MPIINTIKGDLIKLAKSGRYTHIAHGCNCFGVMGSGIAPQIANSFEGVREADLSFDIPLKSKKRLGKYSVSFENAVTVLNLYTQYSTATKKGECVVDYKAIKKAFSRVEKVYKEAIDDIKQSNGTSKEILLGIPQIGAGLAGGDWEKIEEIINKACPTLPIELVIYEK